MRHVLITGEPGVGKTTVFLAALHELKQSGAALFTSPMGFVTNEIRGSGGRGPRVGFEIQTIPDGVRARLASVADASVGTASRGATAKVGRYDVHLDAVANTAVPAVLAYRQHLRSQAAAGSAPTPLVAVDEIGKMECLCADFAPAVRRALDEPNVTVLATVAAAGRGFIEEVKMRRDVNVFTVTRANRDDAPATVAALLRRAQEHVGGD